MLHKFVSLATLIPMLLHSILGCCWHHAHCELAESSGWQTVNCEHHSGASRKDQHSACGDRSRIGDKCAAACGSNCPAPRDHQGTPHEPCREDRCVYVGFPQGDLPKLALMPGFPCASENAVHYLSPMAIACSHSHSEQPPQTLLSTRARTQVWLI